MYMQNSYNAPQIVRVNGENGARAYQMMPNASALLLDETAPLVWLAQTDGAGTMVISLTNNGVAIPGASASVTVASGDSYQVSIPCVVRLSCGEIGSISAILSGVSASMTNASVNVEKM